MATSIFVLVTALLIDVYTCIGILSLTFQKESVNHSAIRHNGDSAVATMRTIRNGSPTVDNVLQELDLKAANDTRVTYKSVTILHNQNLNKHFDAVRRDFIDTLIDNLTRFPHEGLQSFECFDIVFNPKRNPKEQSKLAAYGTDLLNTLCDHYSELLDDDSARPSFCNSNTWRCPVQLTVGILTVLSKYCSMTIQRFTQTLLY